VCSTNQVQLTWDETDNDRVSTLNRKFNKDELLAMDFNAYLASSSEEEEEGEEAGFVFGEQEREDDAEEGEEEEDDDNVCVCVCVRDCVCVCVCVTDVFLVPVAAQRAEEPVVENKSQKKKEEKKKKSEEQISKYRELLKGIRVKEKKLQEDDDVDMEITWAPGTGTGIPVGVFQYVESVLQTSVIPSSLCRPEGGDGAAGEEEAGGRRPADAVGGVPAEEEGQEEAEEASQEGGVCVCVCVCVCVLTHLLQVFLRLPSPVKESVFSPPPGRGRGGAQ